MSLRTTLSTLALVTCVTGMLPLAAQAQEASASARSDFLQAWKGDGDATTDSPALRNYLLYPDLLALRLLRRTGDRSADADIGRMLDAPTGDLQTARRLRAAWIDALAERGDWSRVLRYWRDDGNDERACVAGEAAIRVEPDAPDTLARAESLYLHGESRPKACDPVFAWLQGRGALNADLIEKRARLALAERDGSLTRYLARQLDASRAAPLLQAADWLERPGPSVDAYISGKAGLPLDGEALRVGWERYARRDSEGARSRVDALAARLQASLPAGDARDALLGHVYAQVANVGAWSRKDWVLGLYRKAPAAGLDETAFEWRVRAAIWAGEWALAARWVEEMPAKLRDSLRWRYWLARSLEASGARDAAIPIYRDLATHRDYYGFLAADRVGTPYTFNYAASPVDTALDTAVANDLNVQRTAEWQALDMDTYAAREWNDAVSSHDGAWLIAAARWADARQMYLQSILTLVRADEWNDLGLRYPTPYRELVDPAARAAGVPPALVYAVMRQESLFRPDAVSRADARGLLQLLPSTARHVAQRTGRRTPTASQLFDPAVNLPLGAAYLREVLDRFGDRLPDALGAYNAGPAPMARWVADRNHDADVWIENIPYTETRNYIVRVSENLITFSHMLGDAPPSLRHLIESPLEMP